LLIIDFCLLIEKPMLAFARLFSMF
jgi:hypothetical protein